VSGVGIERFCSPPLLLERGWMAIKVKEFTPVAPRVGADRGKNRWRLAALAPVVVACVLVAMHTAITLGAFSYYRYMDLIFPWVEVGGVDLSGKTLGQAQAEIERVWNLERQIVVVDGTDPAKSWLVVPGEFGLTVDAQASAAQAYAVGREKGFWGGLNEMLDALDHGRSFVPVVAFDRARARLAFVRWSGLVDEPAVEATFEIVRGDVIHSVGRAGSVLDVDGSLALLASDPKAVMVEYGFIPLLMVPQSPAVEDYAALVEKVEALLGAGPALTAYDPVTDERFDWRPGREEIASWLLIHTGEASEGVDVSTAAIEAFVEGLDASLGAQRTFDHQAAQVALMQGLEGEGGGSIRIRYRPRTHLVRPVDTLVSIGFETGMPYWRILEDNPDVARRGLVVGETIQIPPKDALLELPIVEDKRIVISIHEQRMWVYQQDELLWEHVVSTGIPNSPTLPGIFQIQTHELNAYASIWDLYMPHFMGIYKATPDLMNGIHGLPLLSSGVRLWADVLGQPASFGCIILELDAASQLYHWAEQGVVVEIQP
jgi:lipoprotein-anchoring transpeptidase ErfK/SrfK